MLCSDELAVHSFAAEAGCKTCQQIVLLLVFIAQ